MEPMHQQSKIMEKFCSRQILHSYSSLIFSALMLMRTDSSTMLSPSSLLGTVKPFLVIFIKGNHETFHVWGSAKNRQQRQGKQSRKIQKAVKPLSMSQKPLSLPHTCGETLQEIYWKISPLLTPRLYKRVLYLFSTPAMEAQFPQHWEKLTDKSSGTYNPKDLTQV